MTTSTRSTRTAKAPAKAPAKAKATTAKRPAKSAGASTTGVETVKVPSVIRFKSALTRAEVARLEEYLSAAGNVALTITGLAVALTYAEGTTYAEEHLSGSLRSWAISGAAFVRKAGIETTADPRFRDAMLVAENRGADAIAALTPAKAKAALVALGAAETVKAKRAAIKASVPTTKRGAGTGNAKAVKVTQVAARITKAHESLPSSLTGTEEEVTDLLTVLARFTAEVQRIAGEAKAPATK
jgi:hypothetical protein